MDDREGAGCNSTGIASVGTVSQVIYRAKVVNTNDLNIVSFLSSAEYETSDTSESINTYFNHFV